MLSSIALFSLLGSALATPVDPVDLFKVFGSSCSTSGAASCHNTTSVDTCCTEYPGGLLLQTQFWDTDVAGSPADSWTIHGLWPDNCDGTYKSSCDPSRAYKDISSLLTAQNALSTLDFMKKYWLNNAGTSEELWEHEWAKHGTCYSTLEPSCLPKDSPKGAEAVAFFETTVKLFKSLPTYTWLANADITPSTSKTYTLSELTAALEKGSGGYTPALGCTSKKLNSISWYYNLKGSLVNGKFVPIDSPQSSTCPSSGIEYPVRQSSS